MDPIELEDRLYDLAFAEDIGSGDHTTLCCIPEGALGRQHLLVKQDGVLAGVRAALEIFRRFDPGLETKIFIKDGSRVKKGDIAFVTSGRIRSLLQTERLMLNVMQRMSGIATLTSQYMELLKGTKAKVLDTRKTTPGMRILEKEAVRLGGGCNHRMGLFDMILLKDNHVDFAGGIAAALAMCRRYLEQNNLRLKIEIEVRNFEELEEALAGKPDRIMLDNFTVGDTHRAVELIGGRVETESSGGITRETIRAYAEQGVDYISVGELTHSVRCLDLSFKAEE